MGGTDTMEQLDQLIYKDEQLYFKDIFCEEYALPNLTNFVKLYHETQNQTIQSHIGEILSHDLGTLLVVEIMIDPTHEITLKRLETGEISKNMKHVMDYYVILKSHYALAKKQYLSEHKKGCFETCHFIALPFGQVIMRSKFETYYNLYSDTAILKNIL